MATDRRAVEESDVRTSAGARCTWTMVTPRSGRLPGA